MADFAFEKADDITIKMNGNIVGGIKRAVCSSSSAFYEISQFLTDLPVDRIAQESYRIELVMNGSDGIDFSQGESIERLELSGAKRNVIYTDCFVAGITESIVAGKKVEYTVVITANERREL